MPELLPLAQYFAQMHRKRMAAGVLYYDQQGRVLLVEPSYKDTWELPGGGVEEDESPWAAAVRELAEELGTTRALGRLLLVDYVSAQDPRPEGVVFIFDGGPLRQSDVDAFEFVDGEILSAGFFTVPEVRDRVRSMLADRIEAAFAAISEGVTVLCEDGRRVA
jgi:8-oxo-dGTP pyrophosphatase MutT (NUDIX family)